MQLAGPSELLFFLIFFLVSFVGNCLDCQRVRRAVAIVGVKRLLIGAGVYSTAF